MPLKDKRLRAEYMRRYNERRKEAGLCLSCNNPVVWKNGRPQTLCRYHINRERRRKANRIYEEQRCCSCGTIRNGGHQGKVRCSDCTRKYREYGKSRYNNLKEAGLCTNCGKKKAVEGRVKCRRCSQMFLQSQIRYRRNKENKEPGRKKKAE